MAKSEKTWWMFLPESGGSAGSLSDRPWMVKRFCAEVADRWLLRVKVGGSLPLYSDSG
jgi:hypothetical protein